MSDPLVDLLPIANAVRFGLDYPVEEVAAGQFIDRAIQSRAAGLSFT